MKDLKSVFGSGRKNKYEKKRELEAHNVFPLGVWWNYINCGWLGCLPEKDQQCETRHVIITSRL